MKLSLEEVVSRKLQEDEMKFELKRRQGNQERKEKPEKKRWEVNMKEILGGRLLL